MKIGKITVAGAALAPMAGVADRAFREICLEYGAAYVVGEMTSVKGLSYGSRKSAELLRASEKEHPMAAQLFGREPELIARAAERAAESGADAVDMNMGCPAPKITGQGCGCALMKEPDVVDKLIRAAVRAAGLPVTVKFRLGWDEGHINVVELCRIAEQAGAAAVTVHGRTAAQMYSGQADLEWIAKAARAVHIPVVGNGDISDGPSARRMLEATGSDLCMVGRGALGAPWVFRQIQEYLRTGKTLPDPPLEQRLDTLKRQAALAAGYKGEAVAMREMRKHAAWYVKGLRGAAAFRRQSGELCTYEDLVRLCGGILNEFAGS